FLLYPFVITLQDWSVNYVRKLKCQPCVEAAQLDNAIPTTEYRNSFNPPSLYGSTQDQNFIQNPIQCLDLCPETICVCSVVSLVHFVSYLFDSVFNFLFQFK
ncbi:MAG: hypothetical protein M3P08_07390, partial [Thermoproteota archaeon]|nr:hypothetical protein [Thermoproteota archaeon]